MSGARAQLKALRRRVVPQWWSDAKLGIFVHWTPASVPGFAPVDAGIGELLRSNERDALKHSPYTEWYENSLRFPDSAVSRHHRETYGHREYAEFARDWEHGLELWDPERWAAAFRDAGAQYVVLVAKHADGYCMWPTDTPNPHRDNWHSRRDVVGEMSDAVRGTGLRFGIYYCGGFDWTFDSTPIGTMSDVVRAVPRGRYPAYAEAQVRELVDRYRPNVLWNDVAWPASRRDLWPLLSYYYDAVPDGVINDRWMPWSPLFAASRVALFRRAIDAGARRATVRDGGLIPPVPPHFDFRTAEYVTLPEIEPMPWEYVRGMDRSFGYNASSGPGDFVSRDDLLWEFTDAIAKGGNLLLNVGPRGVDASIPAEQADRLGWMGEHVRLNGEAIVAARPWAVSGSATPEGSDLRYTARADAVFAFLRNLGTRATLADVRSTPLTRVDRLDGGAVSWRDEQAGLVLEFGVAVRTGDPIVVALRGVEARRSSTPWSGPVQRGLQR